MVAGGTHFVVALSRSGLLSFRPFSSLPDVREYFPPVLHIGGILYDVFIPKAPNHALKNMSDLDLSHEVWLSKNPGR